MRKGLLLVFTAVLAIAAIMILNVVRSNMLAAQRSLKTAVVEYSTISRIYAQSAAPQPNLAPPAPVKKTEGF